MTNREYDDKIKHRWLLILLPNSYLFYFIEMKCEQSYKHDKGPIEGEYIGTLI
ncbi:conserved hypothetical protein [Bacillus sp. 349Y]|nr:conserved hypothetical protein [Bacillus sp. 349Y]